jgi:ferredoxin
MPKIVLYRNRCIGCSICYEQQPELWRLSKKDGKATLLKSTQKKNVFILSVPENIIEQTRIIAEACPVKIIKIYE